MRLSREEEKIRRAFASGDRTRADLYLRLAAVRRLRKFARDPEMKALLADPFLKNRNAKQIEREIERVDEHWRAEQKYLERAVRSWAKKR
jgi:hypothetical protein